MMRFPSFSRKASLRTFWFNYLHKTFKRQMDLYDQQSTVRRFQSGDAVYIVNKTREIGVCRKLLSLYMGPAIVLEKISNFVYRVQTVQKGSHKCLNLDKLIFFFYRKQQSIMDRNLDKLIFFFTGKSNQSWIEATQENLN